jgi:hypothetical protein
MLYTAASGGLSIAITLTNMASWVTVFLAFFHPICLTNTIRVDRVGFEPTTSAMPMPYPTGLDDRPLQQMNSFIWLLIVLT